MSSANRQKRIIQISLALISTAFLAFRASAQESAPSGPVKFLISVQPESLTVGDEVTIRIRAEYPDSLTLTPKTGKFIDEKFALKRGPEIKNGHDEGRQIDEFAFIVSPFEIGEMETPAFEFALVDRSGKARAITAPTEKIYVKSLLPADTTGLDIKDIIGPKALPTRWWIYALLTVIITIVAGAAYYLYRRRLSRMEIPQAPPEPPYDIAIRELAALKEKDLLGKGKFKQFYIDLSDIHRKYIEGRFEIRAVEATTYELKRILRHPELPIELAQETLAFLTRADLVKFAKFAPAAEIMPTDFELVRQFVNLTRPIETPAEVAR